jgi:predicted O-methyltransferase YrrM
MFKNIICKIIISFIKNYNLNTFFEIIYLMFVSIDGNKYMINDDEFVKINHDIYNNLHLYNDIAIFEQLIGLIKSCKKIFINNIDLNSYNTNFISYNTTHGGFIPINLVNDFDILFTFNTNDKNLKNINYNINSLVETVQKSQFININDSDISEHLENYFNIFFNIDEENINFFSKLNSKNNIFITKLDIENNAFEKYLLKNTEYYIYVTKEIHKKFIDHFKYNIENNKLFNYNNLINLCIMVKNAGPQFEEMLEKNIDLIDKWTILDTGSTDGTQDIIKRMLVGKKDGKLYEEPFINFRDSRNRLLDLAGTDCKYNLMLDDTYIVNGDLRNFLTEIRSDQYANSFTLYIHSDDTIYGSNRITKSTSNLRYIHRIHEVITDKNNINVVIPENRVYIFDRRFDYMEKRTMERKELDLQLLFEEIEENPNDPRAYYYLAQTYNLLGDYQKAFFYFLKRCEIINAGFLQERVDAAFEAARLANFKLDLPWNQCEELYLKAFKIDESRPESLYFIGIHYYLENNMEKAYNYFKQSFEIGFPIHCQYSLKPTLSYHFLPKFLTRVCYNIEDYKLGEIASYFFLKNNSIKADDYREMESWYNIYKNLNHYTGPKIVNSIFNYNLPLFVFVADGGFNPWSGSTILEKGVGGSETYIIEMARWIQQSGKFQTMVFCNTPNDGEIFQGTIYKPLNQFYEFVNTNYINTCIISRFSEYLPLAFKGWTENVYLVLHDLTPTGVVIPIDNKLKNIFCLTEWHVEYFTQIFPQLKSITVPFYYGCDFNRFYLTHTNLQKIRYSFIYSSFPNRGLLELLQMWPRIYHLQPLATLHIYSDVNNKWSNDVESEKMNQIRILLNDYSKRDNGLGVFYHGWVKKSVLEEAWKKADIWFYPCTFMETFCLTALEAACSKTLAITNDLAALQNTVSDRGIIIKGDPREVEWQEKALEEVKKYLSNENLLVKNSLIERNYNWSKTLSWKSQAEKFLDLYILPNKLEYKGMYNWTNDIPSGSKEIFLKVIDYFNNNYCKMNTTDKIRVLEIGTYTGISLINIIKNIPNSIGIGIDTWSNYNENNLLNNVDNLKVKESFIKNVICEGVQERIIGIQSKSQDCLLEFIKNNDNFDFIYVDGSHLLLDCYLDLFLSWQILKIGGILVIDDYLYKKDTLLESPYEGVNHFLKGIEGKYNLISKSYRVFIEKTTI